MDGRVGGWVDGGVDGMMKVDGINSSVRLGWRVKRHFTSGPEPQSASQDVPYESPCHQITSTAC